MKKVCFQDTVEGVNIKANADTYGVHIRERIHNSFSGEWIPTHAIFYRGSTLYLGYTLNNLQLKEHKDRQI